MDLCAKIKIGLTTRDWAKNMSGYLRDFGPNVRMHMFPLANVWTGSRRHHVFNRGMLEKFVFNVVSALHL